MIDTCEHEKNLLLEQIAYLERQLKGCAVAARSYEAGLKFGAPFGDAFKAVLRLRQNADAAFRRTG